MSDIRVLAWPAFGNPHNRYTSLLYHAMAGTGVQVEEFSPGRLLRCRYDVWHLHWPEALLDARYPQAVTEIAGLLLLMDWARRRGTRLLWTIHNLGSHEHRYARTEAVFWREYTRRLDAVIGLTQGGLDAARARFLPLRGLPAWIVPHGHYRGAYATGISRAHARVALHIPADAPVITFFGTVRSYKNVSALVQSFRALPDPRLRLVIAGKATGSQFEALRGAAESDRRIQVFPDFIADSMVQYYLGAADLVVLPFADILNSGSALLALSFDRPVLVPHLGALPELRERLGADWVRTYSGPLNAGVLQSAIEWMAEQPRHAPAPVERPTWNELAGATVNAYRELLHAG